MPDRPQGLLSNPQNTSGGVTKCPPPQGRQDSGRPLAAMSLAELNGAAANAFDPMRGRILSDRDPRAQAILAKQAENVKAQQEAVLGKSSKKKNALGPGHRVFHEGRKEYGVVVEASADNKRIEVIFPRGKRALVQLRNLKKV
jgi:hypothetical protein